MNAARRTTLPIINLSAFRRGLPGDSEHASTISALAAACEETGFFAVTGHGVAPERVARLKAACTAFFDLPEAEKRRVGETGEQLGGLMYLPHQHEALAATLGAATPPDLKQVLDQGPGFYGDAWPTRPPDLQAAWEDYFAALSDLAAVLRRLFAMAVGLPAHAFETSFDRHMSSLRVIDYPEPDAPPMPGQLRAGDHSDYGFLTILHSEDRPGGLQLLNRAGHWVDVPAVPGGFVVNIGDCMMRWSNDRWVSTRHRVVNPPAATELPSRRQSIAYFHNPNRDAVIECLTPFRDPDGSAKYPPITYGAYAEARYRQSHGIEGRQLKPLWGDETGP